MAALGGSRGFRTMQVIARKQAALPGRLHFRAAMAHGDSSVKARLCQREVLAGMMGLAGHLRPHLQVMRRGCCFTAGVAVAAPGGARCLPCWRAHVDALG